MTQYILVLIPCQLACQFNLKMGLVRIRHSSHGFEWKSSHSVDLAGWQVKMASVEIWIP